MNKLNQQTIEKSSHIKRDSFIWNMCASVAYSLQSAFLLMIVTRVAGLYAAGIFSIAYTTAYMFTNIGNYAMRSYQVSDLRNVYRFNTYYTSRIITTVLMLLLCMGYSVLNGYQTDKIIITLLFCLFRTIECIEDVFHGELQKRGRLDIASKMMLLRIVAATLAFLLVFVITRSLAWATATLTLTSIIAACGNYPIIKSYQIKAKIEYTGVAKLLIACCPLCIGAFLYSYLVNSPKYAIDAVLSEEMQTIFNIIFMPVFVINLVSSFIFKPYITDMSILWKNAQKQKFIKLILRQISFIGIISIFVLIIGYIMGIPVLSLIYGVDLSEYKLLFLELLFFGAISAINTFMGVVLTVIRKQMYIMVSYIVAFVASVLFMNYLVAHWQLWGGTFVYGLVMIVILCVSVVGVIVGMKKS